MATPAPGSNRLAGSNSPYLLQHAGNPVDWYPWGPEALARAREEEKPIFLSVGYSTCHWCHVMAHESFSSPEVAELMNRWFVNVKVDREERPDVDEVYMVATQLLAGQGGWPNSVFLTPELEPFFAGTYFPPDDRYGRPGFPRLLAELAAAWRERRHAVRDQARQVAQAMGRYLEADLGRSALPGAGPAAVAASELAQRFDPVWGGFDGAPKFPTPGNLLLLLESDHPRAREMLTVTLDRMARGGIYDQIGGGFHRYATDREWLVPHFEKMLYDNALLLEIYARAWAAGGDAEQERVVRETARFLERELSAPDGGFWSAIDADSEGEEGAFYVWREEQLAAVLSPGERELLAPILGFAGPPFFEGEAWVLHLPRPLAEAAAERGIGREALLERLAPLRGRLLEAREGRPRPATDDKVLADWNGLAIAGLATAGRLLGDEAMVERAAQAAEFVLAELRDEAGTLLHAWRGGRASVPAFLSDYAFLLRGLLALHRAAAGDRWQAAAVALAEEQGRRLAAPGGGFFAAAAGEDLLFRSRDPFDGAVPSGNGVAALALLELAAATGERRWREEAERAVAAFGVVLARQPGAVRTLALAARRLAVEATGGVPVATASRKAPLGMEALTAEAAAVVEARLEVEPGGAGEWRPFRLRLRIAPGWHLQAEPAPGMEAARLAAAAGELAGVEWPPAARVSSPGGEGELAVWQGEVEVHGRVRPDPAGELALRLSFQACDEARCLPPVTVAVRPASGAAER